MNPKPGEGPKQTDAKATIPTTEIQAENKEKSFNEMTPGEIVGKTAIAGDSIGQGISSEMRRISRDLGGKPQQSARLDMDVNGIQSIFTQIDLLDPAKHPLLILQGGGNHLRGNPAKIAEIMIKAYEKAVTKGFKRVVLLTISPHKDVDDYKLGTKARLVNEELRKLAQGKNIELFDMEKACDATPTFQLAGDGAHPTGESYQKMSRMLIEYLRGKEYIQGSGSREYADQIAAELLTKVENPGDLQKTLIEEIQKLNLTPEQVEEIRGMIGKASIKDLRFGRIFAQDVKEDNEKRIGNIKEETLKRLLAYTDYSGAGGYSDQWFTLNYSQIDQKAGGGNEHEMKIGVGDILLDPEIEQIVIIKNGLPVHAKRGVVGIGRHSGRLGFVDDQGEYIATHTGDKFRILSNKSITEPTKFIEKIDQENEERKTSERVYKEIEESDQITSKTDQEYKSIEEQIKTENSGIEKVEMYKKMIELAKKKSDETTDDAEKAKYLIITKDCEANIKALEILKSKEILEEFDINLYKRAILANESGGNYKARNDGNGRKRGVSPEKWAFGKYQFISPTARSYGADIDPLDENSIQSFLNNPVLQEEVMNNMALDNLKFYASKPLEQRKKLEEAGYSIYNILGAMHFAGRGGVNFAKGTIPGGSDWLGGSVSSYQKTINRVVASA